MQDRLLLGVGEAVAGHGARGLHRVIDRTVAAEDDPVGADLAQHPRELVGERPPASSAVSFSTASLRALVVDRSSFGAMTSAAARLIADPLTSSRYRAGGYGSATI